MDKEPSAGLNGSFGGWGSSPKYTQALVPRRENKKVLRNHMLDNYAYLLSVMEEMKSSVLFLSFFIQWDCIVPESSVKPGLSCAFLNLSVSRECIPRRPYFEQV